MRRKAGQASIEEHPKGSGRYRVRARINGKLTAIASGLSEPEAKQTADAYTEVRNEQVLREGVTLGPFGRMVLDARELRGIRDHSERNRWLRFVEEDPIASLPVATIGRRDVAEWRDRQLRKKRAPQTYRNARNLLSAVLDEACERQLLDHNPVRDVKLPRRLDATSKEDLAGVLSLDEQRAFWNAIDVTGEARFFHFMLFTGLRHSEACWLTWRDVNSGKSITVRRSKGGLPPKGGKPRVVPLLAPALLALPNQQGRPEDWVFPALHGGRRAARAPKAWSRWLKSAGITRRIRVHDLRHTCATSLLAGWWGRKWSLDEVCKMLGHSGVDVTERYARKLDETLSAAVAATQFPASSHPKAETGTIQQESCGAPGSTRTTDLRFRKPRTSPNRNTLLSHATFPVGNTKELAPSVWALVQSAERVLGKCSTSRPAARRAS